MAQRYRHLKFEFSDFKSGTADGLEIEVILLRTNHTLGFSTRFIAPDLRMEYSLSVFTAVPYFCPPVWQKQVQILL